MVMKLSAPLIIANWKSHKSVDQSSAWLQEYQKELGAVAHDAEVAIAPAFPALPVMNYFLQQAKLKQTVLAVQDLSPFPAGAYTGAISVKNLEGLPIKYAIVGHSERRRYFHETDQEVANKVDQAILAEITPVVCVDVGYLESQASTIEKDALAKCIVAYEPLAAIGTGNFQPVVEVKPVIEEIKKMFGDVQVIYGGSVNAANVSEYLTVVDGVLVGGQSLEAKTFAELVLAS